MAAHPHGHPGAASTQQSPLHPQLRRAVPGWVLAASTIAAWAQTGATAFLFFSLGSALDVLSYGERLLPAEIITLILIAAAAAIWATLGAGFSAWAASDAERQLRSAALSSLYRLGAVDVQSRAGSLLSLLTDGVQRTANYRAVFLGPMIGALTTPLLVLAIMALTVSGKIAGILALLLLIVPIVIGAFRRAVRPIGRSYRMTQGRLTAAFLEAIQALDTLVYARAAGRSAADLARRGEEHRSSIMRMLAGNQLLIFVVDAAFSLTVVVAAAVLSVQALSAGTLSLGGALAILLMTTLVIGPVDIIGRFFYIGISGRAAQRSLSDHLSAGTAPEAPGASSTKRPRGDVETGSEETVGAAISLRDVAAGWPGGPPVLAGLSIDVEPGEHVALIGPSGAGKSTVASLIQAHLLPRSGHVTVGGLDTRDAEPEAVREQLAVVEQQTFLFMGTIEDNLRIAAPEADDDQLWDALETAGLAADVRQMPAGLATPVGEHGRLLSGGQAQRLAIARAALRDAPILILDEPTSQVDLAGEAEILQALRRLAAKRTVLMIAHRPLAVLGADRVIDLREATGKAVS
ncbi:ABC transporter ATP-binding protein/permease [Brevibacterium otitidis]|uniref:ABC transporter ATP-binding protein/permease n=1 Tax=Brevibacterium otitidis TaxID=53364 RepID=A0ABV5X0W6_9MICO|nr:ABC transporter ATP-binding protein [Brevibacterium otitidis]